MAEIVLFHHAQGLTEGVVGLADELRVAGHAVHTPDLYDGHTFATLDEGIDYAKSVGFGTLLERGVAAGTALPPNLVYAGWSLGAMPAQQLAQTRPGTMGALLIEACLPVSEFGAWPDGLPAQIHGGEDDAWFEEDLAAAMELSQDQANVDLFLYQGTEHLFADASLTSYHAEAAATLRQRLLDFVGAR